MSTETRTKSSTGGEKGVKLERYDLIPVGPLAELAEHFGVGASKYANHQWRQGYEWSKSYAALQRHLTAFWDGFDYDVCSNEPENCRHTDLDGEPFVAVREDACFNHTGSHHMAAVAWHAFALMEFKDRYPEHDDRYSTTLARETAAEEEARLLAEQRFLDALRPDPGAIWTLPNDIQPRFGIFARFTVDGAGEVSDLVADFPQRFIVGGREGAIITLPTEPIIMPAGPFALDPDRRADTPLLDALEDASSDLQTVYDRRRHPGA